MNTCETCKHWDTELNQQEVLHYCLNPKLADRRSSDGADASYEQIETGPKFGCIHHEPKV